MTDTEIVDAINHNLSLLAVQLVTYLDDHAQQRYVLSRFAVDCNQLIAQRSQP